MTLTKGKPMVAQLVSLVDCGSGHRSYAVWIGTARDPDNPRGLIGARFYDVYPSKTKALAAIEALRAQQGRDRAAA
jgi:hypothetical protein